MEIYEQFKSKYADSVLFFSFGMDHICFFEDADLVSSAFDLPLDHRAVAGKNIPMISMDECLFKVNLNKLIGAGHKVTVCEKLGARDIVKTYQPGKTKAG